MFSTVRYRLVAWNVLVLLVILSVLGGAVYNYFSSGIYSAGEQLLRNQELKIRNYLTENGWDVSVLAYYSANSPFDENDRSVISTDSAGDIAISSDCPTSPQLGVILPSCPGNAFKPLSKDALLQVIQHGGTDLRVVSVQGESQLVYTYEIRDGYGTRVAVFQTSRTVAGETDAVAQLRHLLLLGGLLGIVLSGFGSFFLANRALIPIREAFARQRQFTADASHELRTPLSLIRANAEMLNRHGDRLPEGDSELVDEIIRESDHLSRLVGDLLTLARADSDRVKLSTKPVDLRSLVSDVHEDVQRIAESRGIESHLTLNGPVVVDGDEVRLRQLLLILFDNALKYTDPGGAVNVSVEREDGRAHLQVADTGIGIPQEDLPHVFERFYRVDRAREHESGGTGLGLAIARWIVDAHHGTIKVESTAGNGTQFEVDLPASET